MSDNTALESTYRFALRAYPSRWRAQHGDELLGVMLDVAASQDKAKASPSDIAHLVLHGMTARMNQLLSAIPRRRRDRLAAVGLITSTALALVMMILGELGRWYQWQSYTFTDDLFGPATTPAAIVFILTFGAFLAHASSRETLAKILHAVTIAACVGLAVFMKTTSPAIVVPLSVFIFFAGAHSLALLGDPLRTPVLRRLVLMGSPLVGGLFTFTSYIQGGGVGQPFWRPNEGTSLIDAFNLSLWGAELMLIAALIVVSGSKLQPWAHLVLTPLAATPLTGLLLRINGAGSGIVSIDLGIYTLSSSVELLTLCSVAAVASAWVAWKRPTLSFPTHSSAPNAR